MDIGYSVSVFCVVYVLVATVTATTVTATAVSANGHLPCDEGHEGPCG